MNDPIFSRYVDWVQDDNGRRLVFTDQLDEIVALLKTVSYDPKTKKVTRKASYRKAERLNADINKVAKTILKEETGANDAETIRNLSMRVAKLESK